jgi:hypothetical protein
VLDRTGCAAQCVLMQCRNGRRERGGGGFSGFVDEGELFRWRGQRGFKWCERESETVRNRGRRGLATGGGFRGGGGGGASWALNPLMRLRAQGLGNLSVRGSQCLGEWGGGGTVGPFLSNKR